MTSATHIFLHFFKEAWGEVKNNFSKYLPFFLSLVFLANIDEAYKAFGGQDGDGWSIALTLLSVLLTFVITAKIISMHKKNNETSLPLIYILIPYLLYSFYFSLLFFLGLVIFILPGFWVLIYCSQAPLLAALSSTDKSLFKESIRLVKKNVKLVAYISFCSLFLEFAALIFEPIANQKIRWAMLGLFSFPDALLTLVLTIVSVKIFYYLQEQ